MAKLPQRLNMISKRLANKLRDPEYRKAFVASQINIGLPFQLRALLKNRRKTQEWLAEKAGMLQPRISGLLSPGKTRPNIETLRRLAEAFDCGLAVRFVPFTELAEWSEAFDPENFDVPDFDRETEPSQEPKITAAMPGLTIGLQALLAGANPVGNQQFSEGMSLQEMGSLRNPPESSGLLPTSRMGASTVNPLDLSGGPSGAIETPLIVQPRGQLVSIDSIRKKHKQKQSRHGDSRHKYGRPTQTRARA